MNIFCDFSAYFRCHRRVKPQKYQKRQMKNKIDFDALFKAIKGCLIDNKAVRTTAKQFNLPHTHATLECHVKKVKASFEDVPAVSDSDLMDFIREKRMKLPKNMINVI